MSLVEVDGQELQANPFHSHPTAPHHSKSPCRLTPIPHRHIPIALHFFFTTFCCLMLLTQSSVVEIGRREEGNVRRKNNFRRISEGFQKNNKKEKNFVFEQEGKSKFFSTLTERNKVQIERSRTT